MEAAKKGSSLLQGVLVASCCPKTEAKQLIKDIAGQELITTSELFGSRHQVACYPWHISNKYYDADVHLFDVPQRDLISEHFAKCVEAVVVFFDNEEESSFNEVKSWLPFIEEFSPEIKILTCNTAKEDSKIPRIELQNWCISNEFELVEIYPQEASDDEEFEDDFKESNSVKRIVQALQAHTWPAMDIKSSPDYKPSSRFKELLELEVKSEMERHLQRERAEAEEGVDEDKVQSLLEQDMDLFHDLEREQDEGQSFGQMFTRFQDMKGDERRLYAEKVAVAFWRALGGDEDEVAAIGEDPENETPS